MPPLVNRQWPAHSGPRHRSCIERFGGDRAGAHFVRFTVAILHMAEILRRTNGQLKAARQAEQEPQAQIAGTIDSAVDAVASPGQR